MRNSKVVVKSSFINNPIELKDAKSFKQFVNSLKDNEAFDMIRDNHEVCLFCVCIESNGVSQYRIQDFLFDELNLYFKYLHFISKYKNKSIDRHTKWLANNVSFEDLYELINRAENVSIVYNKIYYNNELLLDLFA